MGLLTGKYKYAMETAKGFHFDGTTDERDVRLYIKGTVATQSQANKIWDAIKTIPDWPKEIVADIIAVPGASAPAAASVVESTYTVKAGDTLSKIAKETLGDATAYTEIFNANRDQLVDPDTLKPGQVLKIPQVARR